MGRTDLRWMRLLGAALVLVLAATAACTLAPDTDAGGEETPAVEAEHTEEHAEEGEEHEHEEGEDHEQADRLPNDGAIVRIVSPEAGATLTGTEVVVEIETENFALGEDGRHWHVYVDGESMGMVGGGATDYALRGLVPGEHEISVYLGLGTHEELEEGATVTITLEG